MLIRAKLPAGLQLGAAYRDFFIEIARLAALFEGESRHTALLSLRSLAAQKPWRRKPAKCTKAKSGSRTGHCAEYTKREGGKGRSEREIEEDERKF